MRKIQGILEETRIEAEYFGGIKSIRAITERWQRLRSDRPSISVKATLSRHVQSIIFFEHHRSRSRTNRDAVNIE